MGIGKESEDALAITKWKLPGQVRFASHPPFSLTNDRPRQRAILAADALVCAASWDWNLILEILSKRPFRDEFGDMTVEQVNGLLDHLSAVSKE